jgi:hypoxanthine phosphoribosyltransferase
MNISEKPLISQGEIAAAVGRLAGELDADYLGKSPVLVGVLKGAFVFLADIIRVMTTLVRGIEFVRLSSYGSSTVSSGEADIVRGIAATTVERQHVIVIEDIIDTGLTTSELVEHIEEFAPASVAVCTLLDKPSRRRLSFAADYIGITIPDAFVVGYGLDFDERYRDLPAIHVLSER